MAERRRGLTANEATPVAKPVAKPKPTASKPKSQAAAAKPWWWYATPAGIANEIKYRQQQQARINKGYTRVRGLPGVRGWMGPDGNFTTSLPTQRDVVLGAAKVPANVANLAINAVQRVGNGNKPADPGSTPAGRVVTGAQRALTSALQMPQPEQRNPEDLFWQDMGEQFTAGAIGGLAAGGLVKATAFTGGAMANAAPWAQRALRWTAGVGTESVVATPLVDNTRGNVANAFGENAPLAVQPTDDPLSATVKSLLPNAFAEIAAAGMFLGAGEGLGAIGRQAKAARDVGDAAKARNWTVNNGFQTEADGDFDFTFTEPAQQQATQRAQAILDDAGLEYRFGEQGDIEVVRRTPTAAAPEPAAAAPTTAAAPEAAPAPEPVAPTNLKEAENQLLGPDDADVDVEAPVYDASLPEVDLPVQALDRLDDQRLVAAASGEGPVLPEIERQLQDQQATFQVEEGLGLERVSAPTQNLANPVVDYETQWQQLPHNTLISLASPANNPQLFDRIHLMTGRNFEELTRTDVIDGLKAVREEGITVLPNRLQSGADLFDVNSIAVDPPRFQFKDNVNAQGQQKGNSLEGVDRWNTDAEGSIQVWDDPADGQTYVVNGHNRLGKAKELGVPTIRGERLLAQTAEQARAQGAISNISSGGGTAFDAAKVIRELGIQDPAGLEAAGIPLQSGMGAQGLALSKLPGDLFQQAVDGALPMGRALALGGSGLDPADMIRVAGLGAQKDVSERGFAELVQMASSAPKVADADQGGLPGMDEWLKDSSVLEKAELSAKVRAELISNKNLFGKVGKNKAAQKLSEKGGTQVNQEQVLTAADVARGVLDEFDRDKYLGGTPISELLNQGAADIAAGGKPAVIAKRILQHLEKAAEQAPPATPEASVPSAGTLEERWAAEPPEKRLARAEYARGRLLSGAKLKNRLDYEAEWTANQSQVSEYLDEMPGANSGKELSEEEFLAKYGADESQHPQLMTKGKGTPKQLKELEEHQAAEKYLAWYDQQGLLPAQREELKKAVIQKAIANGEVRPSETPLPEVPEGPRDLTSVQATLEDEIRLAEHYGAEDAIRQQVEMEAARAQMGWDRMTLDEKKANGMLDTWKDTRDLNRVDGAGPGSASAVKLDFNANPERTARQFGSLNNGKGKWGITEQQWLDAFKRMGGVPDWFGLVDGKANWEKLMQGQEMPELEAKIKALVQAPGPGPAAAAPAIEIPAAAGRKITAKTAEARITSAAQSLAGWTRVPGKDPMPLEQALQLVRAKGAILDPDAIPGLNVDLARNDQAMGRSTEVTKGVAAAYRQFYGVSGQLSDIVDEGMFQGMDGPPLAILGNGAAQARQRLQDASREAIERITGGDIADLSFEDVYKQHITPREHGGDGVKLSYQAGFYEPFNDAIKVRGLMKAAPASVMESTYHESFHRLQFALMSQKEMEVFDSVFGKIRVDDLAAMRNSRGKATIEKQAYAFQVYAAAKAKGMNVIPDQIRMEIVDALDEGLPRKNGESWGGTLRGEAAVRIFQAFDRVMEYLERLNNAVRGRGFTSVEDLFEKAYSGELAKSRALDFAVDQVTSDQVKRYETLMRWTSDNRVAVAEISQATVSIDIQINALKAQAMAGGC